MFAQVQARRRDEDTNWACSTTRLCRLLLSSELARLSRFGLLLQMKLLEHFELLLLLHTEHSWRRLTERLHHALRHLLLLLLRRRLSLLSIHRTLEAFVHAL